MHAVGQLLTADWRSFCSERTEKTQHCYGIQNVALHAIFFTSSTLTLLLFPPGSRKRQREETGEFWRRPGKTLDFLPMSHKIANEDSSEQILRGSLRALTPLDPDDTFLIGPSEDF